MVIRSCLMAALSVMTLGACESDPEPSSNSGGSGGSLAPIAGSSGNAAGGSGAGGVGGGAGSASPSGPGGSAGTSGMQTTAGSSAAGSSAAGSSPDAGMNPNMSVDSGMDAGTDPDAGTSGAFDCTKPGATARFSFFVTSLVGLRRLSKSENGFGGDLRYGEKDGLSGADKICRELADNAAPGAGCKTWRAFLSVTKGTDGKPVNAGDRIGTGPWYDRIERLVAENKTKLLAVWPEGADPIIVNDLPNEFGVPNHDPDGNGKVDNHNTITGTSMGGMLTSTDWSFTCHDWTSAVGTDGKPRIGFSWLGGAANMNGSSWYASNITEGGCAPIINLTNQMDFNIRGIGALGGYGGFYCLALQP